MAEPPESDDNLEPVVYSTGEHRTLIKVSVPVSLGRRMISILVEEGICLAATLAIVGYLSEPVEVGDLRWRTFNPLHIYSILGLVRLLYFVPQWSVWGRTLPNRLLGVRVAEWETQKKVSWGRAAARALITHAILTPTFIGGAVIVFSMLIARDSSKSWLNEGQGIHDRLAGTVVLSEMTVSHRADLKGNIWDLVD